MARAHLLGAASLALVSLWATATAVAQAPTATSVPGPVASPAETVQGTGPHGSPVVWLRGPFGKVAGGPRSHPAAAPPDGVPLGMVYRRMPLLLEADDPDLLPGIRVTTELVAAGQRESLAQGQAAFEGPSAAGRQLIIASVPQGDSVVERAWLVDVPDREAPDGGLVIDIPAPRIIVSTGSGRQAGQMADGCYAFLCVETGPQGPAGTLPALPARVGETPELNIEDGSALVAWQGELTPLEHTQGDGREARGAFTDTPTATAPLTGLEPSAPGAWLLEVRVEFDRERGWAWNSYRLVVE